MRKSRKLDSLNSVILEPVRSAELIVGWFGLSVVLLLMTFWFAIISICNVGLGLKFAFWVAMCLACYACIPLIAITVLRDCMWLLARIFYSRSTRLEWETRVPMVYDLEQSIFRHGIAMAFRRCFGVSSSLFSEISIYAVTFWTMTIISYDIYAIFNPYALIVSFVTVMMLSFGGFGVVGCYGLISMCNIVYSKRKTS